MKLVCLHLEPPAHQIFCSLGWETKLAKFTGSFDMQIEAATNEHLFTYKPN